jgi:hypothetical protein
MPGGNNTIVGFFICREIKTQILVLLVRKSVTMRIIIRVENAFGDLPVFLLNG